MQQTLSTEAPSREEARAKGTVSPEQRLSFTERDAKAAIDRYEGTVRMMARRLRPVASLGQALDEEDLCAEGRVAVLEALATYRGYGISEQTWVRTRIRQRMIDAIRKLDLRSRDEMSLAVRHASGETEGSDEHERGRIVSARRLVSIDAGTVEVPPMSERLPAEDTELADEITHRRLQYARLRDALELLPARQRLAVEMGLLHGLPLRKIGERMGISESRVCQLQKRAVHHLRKVVGEPDAVFHAA
jgi:RNA polymerase sigma factor FliA